MSNFHIYKKNIHYNLGKIQKKKEMYRQKSVIFTIGKTLYIYRLGQNTKEKRGFLLYIYSQNTTVWARYKRKERVLYRQNTPYIRKNTYNNAYVKEISYIKAHCQI